MAKKKTQTQTKKKINATDSVVTVEMLDYYHTKDEALTDGKLATKQNATDNTLETTSKTVVGAINEVNGKAVKAYHFMGSVESYDDLPTTGQKEGDVYNISGEDQPDYGMNYAWTEEEERWDELGVNVDLSGYAHLAPEDHPIWDDFDHIAIGQTSAGPEMTAFYGLSKEVPGETAMYNIPLRAEDGGINVPLTPDSNSSATSKGYVDTLASGKQKTLQAGTNITLTDQGSTVLISAEGGTTTIGFNSITGSPYDNTALSNALNGKQATLIGTQTTGQNIKTINGQTILGTGDLEIEAGSPIVELTGESGTLTTEQYFTVVNNKNTLIVLNGVVMQRSYESSDIWIYTANAPSALRRVTIHSTKSWEHEIIQYVEGVKGDAETSYRTGNVNITPANIGITFATTEDIDAIFE